MEKHFMLKRQTKPLGETLLKAAKEGDDSTVRSCIEFGVEIETKDKDGRTALHLASTNGHISTMELLLDLGANIQAIDEWHNTPFHVAYNKKSIDFFIQKGANIEIENKLGLSPIQNLGVKATNPSFGFQAIYSFTEQNVKKLERKVEQQDTLIQELQNEIKMLRIQLQELVEQKTLTPKDDDDSTSDKKGYSPSIKFQNIK